MSGKKENDQDLVFKSTLKSSYGLPDSWIERIGKPDMKVPNPHHPDGADASMFNVARVEEFINKNITEYLTMCRKKGFKIGSKQAEKTVTWAKGVDIEFEGVPEMGKLEQEVAAFYKGKVGNFKKSRSSFVDYVRIHYSNYDALVDKLTGKVGRSEGVRVLRDRCGELAGELLDEIDGVGFNLRKGVLELA